MTNRFLAGLCFLLFAFNASSAQQAVPGAECTTDYLRLLKGRRVAVLINQTSRIGNRLLADTLIKCGVRITKIFVPEHGFRGAGDAGAHIANGIDSATGLPIISLYGKNQKPQPEQLKDVDVVVYDLQDVGARFYTYIATLQYMMEACAENGKLLIVLDRPDPNGNYVDGPILDTTQNSFVGMQPVPIVYGMTPGEYAHMLAGEGWMKDAKKLRMEVIRCKGYDHNSRYKLPVAPSPNLRSIDAVYLYPSICLFEGTVVSVGRGTDKPFMQWGHPAYEGILKENFKPESTAGASKPPFEGQTCYGRIAYTKEVQAARSGLQIQYLWEMYRLFPEKDKFFTPFFEKLAGTAVLRKQIVSGMRPEEIKASWQPGLIAFKAIRRKYLLYKDFE